jgi:ribonucleotide reductase beta subunit family protein with ferritin-like domain
MINTYITDYAEKMNLLQSDKINDSLIKKKADWALKWIDTTLSFTERLIAFACVEGIFFSGSFCAIYWFKSRNKMAGLCQSNEYIARDEGMHTEFACYLYRELLEDKLDDNKIINIVTSAVEIEKEFIRDSIPCKLIGMNADEMSKYIEYVADGLLVMLGLNQYWNTKCPFDWMVNINLKGKSNFFEHHPTEYSNEFKNDIFNTNNYRYYG